FFIFFFSSRRRHTRSKRDWSSDVCSSDLCRRLLRYVCSLVYSCRTFNSFNRLMPVIMVKNGTTGNEYVGSSADTTFRCSSVYSAVHLDLKCGTAFFSPSRQLFNFIDCIVNKRLPTKSGINRHN